MENTRDRRRHRPSCLLTFAAMADGGAVRPTPQNLSLIVEADTSRSHPTVGVAVVGLTNDLPVVRPSSSVRNYRLVIDQVISRE